MTKIAEGYFYDVYDLGNGRVLKKKKPFLRIVKDIQKEYPTKNNPYIWFKTSQHIRECVQTTKNIEQKLTPSLSKLLGSPVFKDGVEYEQDKVILLMDYFETHSSEENKKVVDKYMSVLQELLKHGIHDRVYKFKNSFGINNAGEVVFIDFNEVTFSKEKVLALVESKKWESSRQIIKLTDESLKSYLVLRFNETLTPIIVNQLWGTSIK